ncbi:conjugal transfer protein TraF [Thalassotalea aquiviva]|uniref:conjugal transfer protein TraF n=1 Tax=Thalassotalea aquiviva TaxID=3242415 RepID=UPI00352BC42D
MKNKVALGVGIALLSCSVNASSLSTTNQAKSLAMGGVGIAVTDITNAMTHNPAILSSVKVRDSWFLSLPTITLGVNDEDEFVDALDEFQDKDSIDELEYAIDMAGYPGSYNHVAEVADRLSGDLEEISDRRIEADAGAIVSLAVPSQTLGFGLKVNVGASVGGEIHYRDAETLTGLSSDLRAYEDCYQANMNLTGSCMPEELALNYVDPISGEVNFNVDDDLQSEVVAQGLVVGEAGLAFTHMVDFDGIPVSFSVMPKMQKISVYHYAVGVDNADLDDIGEDEYLTEKTAFNADLGMLVELNEHINLGMTLTNIVAQELQTATAIAEGGALVELGPQAKIGAAFEYGWLTLAVDADLTKNKVPFCPDEQVVAFGAELDAWDVAKIRVGFQHDLENADGDLISAGFGLNLLGLTLDIGAATNDDVAIASLQLGYKW